MKRRAKMDMEQRFWNGVDKSGECWIWQRAVLSTGYGSFRVTLPERKMVTAHKYSYELANGPVPAGLVVDHVCHETRCVRPSHLRAVTRKQNGEHRLVESKHARSGVRGVVWNGTLKTWMSQVRHDGKLYIGGHFSTIEEATESVRELRNSLFTNNTLDRPAA
jgi:hypothetical protein